jgi:hypothetical protein
VDLGVRRAELSQAYFKRAAPSVQDLGRVRVDHREMREAIDGQPRRALGVAVKEPVRRQVRPLSERRAPAGGLSDRMPPEGLSDRKQPGD